MDYQIDIDAQTGFAHVTLSGDTRLEDFPAMLGALWSDPGYGGASHATWDFSACNILFDYSEIGKLAQFVGQNKNQRGPTTVGIVAPEDLEFGLTRIFVAMVEHMGYNLQIFREPPAARAWLASV